MINDDLQSLRNRINRIARERAEGAAKMRRRAISARAAKSKLWMIAALVAVAVIGAMILLF